MNRCVAYPSVFERLPEERLIINLNLPEVCVLDDPKLIFNNHGSDDWYRNEFQNKFPVDDIYDVFEMYSNGMRPKQFKKLIKKGKIEMRRPVVPSYMIPFDAKQPECRSIKCGQFELI